MKMLDGYLRIWEAATFLGVSPSTLRNWGREEKVPEFRLHRCLGLTDRLRYMQKEREA